MKVGDAVFGLAPGCFGPAVVLPAGLMVAMPPGLGFVEAATLPTVFVTVYAAFGAAGLTAKDKVNRRLLSSLRAGGPQKCPMRRHSSAERGSSHQPVCGYEMNCLSPPIKLFYSHYSNANRQDFPSAKKSLL